jgi:diguanylate cyclase (GGDEF)-like protein
MRADSNPARSFRHPQTLSELTTWIRERLGLPKPLEDELLAAIDGVFSRHQRLWQESKEEAIQALSRGVADKIGALRTELSTRDATVSSISQYFEELVADLTEKSRRDPKTKLMNFDWFMEQLESFLELEQRVRWSAVGLVDISNFKRYNDALGHAVGDQIIERVARLLGEQIRSDDLLAQERTRRQSPDLHARFGGDEFCFLIPDLAGRHEARAIAERFRGAVARHDWAALNPQLQEQPVRVDVGVVSLWVGRVAERRFMARQLARELIQEADRLMYGAKGNQAEHVYLVNMTIRAGKLVEIGDEVDEQLLAG